MPKIAIDIALLPPEKIMNLCVKINRTSKSRLGLLNKTNWLPHVTLFMGVIETKDIKNLGAKLNLIAQTTKPIPVNLNRLTGFIQPNKTKNYCLSADQTKKLFALHQNIFQRFKQYLTSAAGINAFYKKPHEPPFSPYYLNDFQAKHSLKNYKPHITLRVFECSFKKLPIKFLARRLAICHLGASHTCRKILFETKLT